VLGTLIVGSDRLRVVIAITIGGVWAVVTLASLATGAYTPLTVTTPVMLVMAGFLFSSKKNGGS
jgi:hypothetical protein